MFSIFSILATNMLHVVCFNAVKSSVEKTIIECRSSINIRPFFFVNFNTFARKGFNDKKIQYHTVNSAFVYVGTTN